ncbi:BON domain-containing protein [Deinococcus cellulosilyticus]|uniref:BON domain-containing protein n=1 Tax=Deinococcus cellulosilyticus (strain DSM 18568 / NBRC 106333 / KACC 11606 / 5516J-15) TaxID=1223518 RepID=A0A511MVJ7_DEIC1|nr:BON domain-containing protein [Deinococcus cellulosilyticus]GEM44603.1 hypothetical protein DC3_02380 [Deinococcus cellulosilyticus NBRC 106333 = KACC 11606]
MWPFGKGIVEQIKDVLGQNKVSRDLPVQVEERNGEVVLKGDVPTEDHKSLLETIAESIKGVRSVKTSDLKVQSAARQTASQSSPQYTQAEIQELRRRSSIAREVLRRLEANGELKDDPIAVLQSGHGVVLKGAVDSQHEYNLAIKIARETPEVEMVDSTDLVIDPQAKQKYRSSLQQST